MNVSVVDPVVKEATVDNVGKVELGLVLQIEN